MSPEMRLKSFGTFQKRAPDVRGPKNDIKKSHSFYAASSVFLDHDSVFKLAKSFFFNLNLKLNNHFAY